MQKRIHDFILREKLFTHKERLILGVSGGVDSVVMFHLLRREKYNFEVIHCNFHLRGEESLRDENFVRSLCEKYNVPICVKSFNTFSYAKECKLSIEMAARKLRYDFFEEYRRKKNFSYICVAHHNDDSIETLLMNLIRGCGAKGMRGIQPKNGNIVRPMLCFSRKEILDCAENEQWDFVEDSSNEGNEYLRNRIRHKLIPLLESFNPNVREALSASSKYFVDTYNFQQQQFEKIKESCLLHEGERISIDLRKIDAPMELFLHYLLSPYGFSPQSIENISKEKIGSSGKHYLSPMYEIFTHREKLILLPKKEQTLLSFHQTFGITTMMPFSPLGMMWEKREKNEEEKRKCFNPSPFVANLDAEKMGTEWTIRLWKEGDWFIPYGMKGKKKVSDLLTSLKLSIDEKRRTCLLCTKKGE
ncbi:MAG TPA: tRNA lysidine(34) synthetase TilS, partial [Porphyromonadaceae bacterium]|nr:tRNA lysidine(34) synthetase TilS [Porphyromonadaceae bacterium]